MKLRQEDAVEAVVSLSNVLLMKVQVEKEDSAISVIVIRCSMVNADHAALRRVLHKVRCS